MAIPQRRRLSAILHADLAGSVRMTEGDEDLTFRHLTSVRREIWRPAIESAGGSLVNSTGDSMLAEFGSAVAAVAAAIDIQERMARFNEPLGEEQRLMFRIGVHLGEVIVDEEHSDIFGDGVNLAERIQTLAEPGGIAASRALRDVAELKTEYAFVDGGEHQVKNVSRSLHIYHVRRRDVTPTKTVISAPATLRFQGADLEGRKFGFNLKFDKLLEKGEGLVIGRAFECDAVLSHSTVSRQHARLVLADNVLQIEDLGSTNGTAVDGVSWTDYLGFGGSVLGNLIVYFVGVVWAYWKHDAIPGFAELRHRLGKLQGRQLVIFRRLLEDRTQRHILNEHRKQEELSRRDQEQRTQLRNYGQLRLNADFVFQKDAGVIALLTEYRSRLIDAQRKSERSCEFVRENLMLGNISTEERISGDAYMGEPIRLSLAY